MANKRLSKLKLESGELEPSERSLTDDNNEFSLSGVLSLTTEEKMDAVSCRNGRGMYIVYLKAIYVAI